MAKYGRTYHLPNSPGATSDDKIMSSVDTLREGGIVITEKMDGENTTIHRGGCHARSVDGKYHPSRSWVKAFSSSISPHLLENERVVGENLFAKHSIGYDDLHSYFMGFAFIRGSTIMSWTQTEEMFEILGIVSVPVLYRGSYSEKAIHEIISGLDVDRQEGIVVRRTCEFDESMMGTYMGKWVRPNHVQTDTHWMHQELIQNGLRK